MAAVEDRYALDSRFVLTRRIAEVTHQTQAVIVS
jgi:hypothetical protein